MAIYSVTNTAGSVVSTIAPSTTTGVSFPIELVGQGISLYGEIVASAEYRIMENFTNTIPPVAPVTGMNWYNPTTKEMSYYDGTQFVTYTNPFNNSSSKFPMLVAATGVNLANVGATAIFTNPNIGQTYYPTGILIKTSGAPTAITPAFANLHIATPEDILETISIHMNSANQFAFYDIQGTTRSAIGSETISFAVNTAATGGTFLVDIILFGLVG